MAAPNKDRPAKDRPAKDRHAKDRPANDRFDSVPEDLHRVGAHRGPAARGRGWIAVGWALGAAVLLTFAGLWGLSQINSGISFDLPDFSAEVTPGPVPTDEAPDAADPVVNPALAITVLNGTPTVGMSTSVADYLVAQGWDGAAFGIGSRVNASSSDVAETLVFYNDPANEGAALAMVEALGIGEIRLSNSYPASPLAVLIGSDFVLPAP